MTLCIEIHTLTKLLFLFFKQTKTVTSRLRKEAIKNLLQNVPLKQKGLLKIQRQGNVESMSFFLQNKSEVQVLCHQNFRTRRLQQGEWTGSNQSYFGPGCIYHFSPEPFLVNYAQSLPVITHFFINSCIFLTFFPS